MRFTTEEAEKLMMELPWSVSELFRMHTYGSHDTGYLVLCADNAKFYNHSKNPNTVGIDLPETDNEGGDIAALDIQEGEEITCDYEVMDFAYKQKLS